MRFEGTNNPVAERLCWRHLLSRRRLRSRLNLLLEGLIERRLWSRAVVGRPGGRVGKPLMLGRAFRK